MIDLYNHDKVKVHISFTKGEGFGRPLLEAASTGKPIITTNVVGCKEVVEHGVNGFLCEVKNEQDLPKALNHLCVDPNGDLKIHLAKKKLSNL